jgi:uncharacterized protein with NRDE domain
LVRNYLVSSDGAQDYVRQITGALIDYPGCNLLVGDDQALYFVSNRTQGLHHTEARLVSAGIHGLSNDSLDTPWPKVERSKRTMDVLLRSHPEQLVEDLFSMLADRRPANEDELPSTGIPIDWERKLSAPFIVSDTYGTRASTVVLINNDGVASVRERTFGSGGAEVTRREFSFNRDA